VALARDLDGWGNLCEFITAARRNGRPRASYQRGPATDSRAAPAWAGCEVLLLPQRHEPDVLWICY
jgi:error-prone DNA polymerase